MLDIPFRHEVLKLNKKRTPIDIDTPKKVFGDLLTYQVDERRQEYILDSKGRKQRKMLAFDLVFASIGEDQYDFDHLLDIRLVDGDEWINLPVRSYDLFINTPKKKIRVPRVVITLEYEKNSETKHSKNYASVYDLYDGICQYSHRKLKRSEGSRDHVHPLGKGGKDELPNIVLCDKEINNMKGDNFNHEVGLPEVTPIVPKNVPKFVELRRKNRGRQIPEWRYFLGE